MRFSILSGRHGQTLRQVAIGLFAIVLVVTCGAAKAEDEKPAETPETGFSAPLFRHIDTTLKAPPKGTIKRIRFLADASFPPFSYRNTRGALTGYSVALIYALCKEQRVKCIFIIKGFSDLQRSLLNGEGDAILTGLKQTEKTLPALAFTRPYFRSVARFAVRNENAITEASPPVLAGKRLGVTQGTAHEAFLKRFFSRSTIRDYASADEARDALRTGAIDALFADGTRLMFWLNGSASKGCCRFAGGGFLHRDYFDQSLSIAVKRGNQSLLDFLDFGFDKLQQSGSAAQVYRQFFPQAPW